MRRTCTREQGFTLAELVITSALMGIMFVALGAIYKMGMVGLSKTTVHNDMLGQAQITAARLTREVASSSFDSLSLSPDRTAACFMIRFDENGHVDFDPSSGRPIWQSYVIYYLDGNELKRRVLPLLENDRPVDAVPIQKYIPWGRKPVGAWCSEGVTVARSLKRCTFDNLSGRLRLTMVAEKERLGKKDPETLELTFTTMFRNQR